MITISAPTPCQAKKLYQAIRAKELDEVKAIITSSLAPSNIDFNQYLVKEGVSFIELLKQTSTEIIFDLIDKQYCDVENALMIFANKNQVKNIKMLLTKYEKDCSPHVKIIIINAILKGQTELVLLLKHYFTQFNDQERYSLLAMPAERRELNMVSTVLVAGKESLFTSDYINPFITFSHAIKDNDCALIEALVLLPEFAEHCLKTQYRTPLSFALYKNAAEDIIKVLLDHALDTNRFGVRTENEGEVFFEIASSTQENKITLSLNEIYQKKLFHSVLSYPHKIEDLLTRFPTIFIPIAKAMIETEELHPSLHTRHLENVPYRTVLGKILQKYHLLEPISIPNRNKMPIVRTYKEAFGEDSKQSEPPKKLPRIQ